MARIADEIIQRIKTDISLLRLIESQGYKVSKQGKDHVIHCPFHEDDTPSLIISPKSNLFHCFGCEAAGSVIDWVMKTQGVSFRHAVEILQQDNPALATVTASTMVTRTSRKKLDPLLSTDTDNRVLLGQVVDYYHDTLKQSPEALDYLQARGLDDAQLIDTFKLGFANRTLGYRLPTKNSNAGKVIRGQLQAVGLLRSSGHEHFNGSLVVPVLDKVRGVQEVYGRKICDRLRKGTPKHLYLPGAHAGVWNVEAFSASKEIILCEALIDAMTFWVHGFRNVTASYGTSGFTDDHLAALKENSIERVLIAYDRDEAGNTTAEKLAIKLMAEGIDCFRILFPHNMDANEYARQVTPAPKSLGLVIRKAQWLGKGKAPAVSTVTEQHGEVIDTASGEVIPLVDEQEEFLSLAAVPEPSTTTPLPALPDNDIAAEVKAHEIKIPFGDRLYRVRGLDKNTTLEQLKINLLASCGDHLHIDSFDLYNARHRQSFIKQAAIELGVKEDVIKKDLGKVLLKLETLQEQQLNATLAPEENRIQLTAEEQREALALLQSPDLLNRILTDFNSAGVVGEETNKLVGYLAAVSRKLDKPLAVIIQSSSAAGKSALMDAVLAMIPEEERVQYSAMTGQSLFYMGETNLKNKILAIAEEEGASNASYALKLLQSEGEITIASTGKDDSSGDLVTKEYKVEGPVMLFLTTTAIDIDEELMNRCLVLSVNENREQTEAIHARQRFEETLEGLLAKEEKQQLIKLHRNAQRLLKPLKVVNPYANKLGFLNDKTRTRRDHRKYLTLIRTIALLHQYQRPTKTITHQGEQLQYIEVIPEDIETANRLANEVLGRTLDELPPQTRRLLLLVHEMVAQRCKEKKIDQSDDRFSRRDVRDAVGWTDFQIKTHMKKLEEMEYLLVHRGGRGQSFVYELLYNGEGKSGNSFLMGLTTIAYDEKKEHQKTNKELSSSIQVAPKEHASRLAKSAKNTVNKGLNGKKHLIDETNASEIKNVPPSYRRRAETETDRVS